MSKKTKKEKILAAYRKKLRLLEQAEPKFKVETEPDNNLNGNSEKQIEIKKAINSPLPKYFFIDLKKSIFLIIIIIALEIGLYFAKLIK